MTFSDNSTLTPSRDDDGGGKSRFDDETLSHPAPSLHSVQSPYADTQIISLYVGQDAIRFDIHATILDQSPALASKQSVSLLDLDVPTAHALVHYLYTGQYQDGTIATLQSYRLSTRVYCAAIRYGLFGLADLAKVQIAGRVLGRDIHIFDVLDTARDHAFAVLPAEDIWYLGYLEETVRNAMANDPASLNAPSFIKRLEGCSKLFRVVWKTVISGYNRPPFAAPTVHTEENSDFTISDGASAQENFENVSESDREHGTETIESDDTRDPSSSAKDDDTLHLESIEPITEATQSPGTSTHDQDIQSLNSSLDLGSAPSVTANRVPVKEDPKLHTGTHTRSDSVVQLDNSECGESAETDQAKDGGAVNGHVEVPASSDSNNTAGVDANTEVEPLSRKAKKKMRMLERKKLWSMAASHEE